jgi:nucleoside-diphosphate-sugar epimerase
MKVFVTGASGFIGSYLTKDLLSHGHTVVGLARSDESPANLRSAGVEAHIGSLNDAESLKTGISQCDAVVHLAFGGVTGPGGFAGANALDREAIEVMGEALAGTGKALVIASGTLGVAVGKLATEDTVPQMGTLIAERYKAADLVYQIAREKNVRGIVVRLPPTVHGAGEHGFIPALAGMAKKNGKVLYVDDGSARWPSVHVTDAATLFRLALESGKAGSTYNAVAEEGIALKEICGVLGKKLDLSVEGVSREKSQEFLGMLDIFVAMDGPTSSEKTRKELVWEPTGPTLFEDLEKNYDLAEVLRE